jgi:serine protease inhibitor
MRIGRNQIGVFVLMAAVGSTALSRTSDARDPAALEAAVAEHNRFAIAMYLQLTRDQDRFVFSPFSVSSVMAMALEGARGQTAEEIERIFAIPRDRGARRSSYAARRGADVANAVFIQKDAPFRSTFLDTLSRHYAAARTDVDFDSGVWFAKRAVDAWIESSTGKRISLEDLPRTRMMRIEGPPDALVADHVPDMIDVRRGWLDIGVHPIGIYASRTTLLLKFKDDVTVADANRAIAAAGVEIVGGIGTLKTIFAAVTDDGTFEPLVAALERLTMDPAVEVAAMNPLMSNDGAEPVGYGRLVFASAATLSATFTAQVRHSPSAYTDIMHRASEDGSLTLTLVLSRTESFVHAEGELTAQTVAHWPQAPFGSSNVPVPDTPAFSVKTRSPLSQTVERMGVTSLFSAASNFSGVDAVKTPLVKSVAHHASFSMTAHGFEAAAATAAGSVVAHADPHVSGTATVRPLVFVVQDAKTGLILVMGRMR